MKHTINGRRYEIVYTDDIPGDDFGLLCGLCDSPDTKHKRIYIKDGLSLPMLIDTIIHEVTHAAVWELSEDFVDAFATQLSSILIKELDIKEAPATGE
jgi:hypothetical protein